MLVMVTVFVADSAVHEKLFSVCSKEVDLSFVVVFALVVIFSKIKVIALAEGTLTVSLLRLMLFTLESCNPGLMSYQEYE